MTSDELCKVKEFLEREYPDMEVMIDWFRERWMKALADEMEARRDGT
jgi:hypothetical protein